MSDGLRLLTAIISNGSSEVLRELDDGLFVDDEERAAYHYVKRHFRRFGQFPAIATVGEECGTELPDAPDSAHYYLDLVYRRRLYNEVRPLIMSMREALRLSDFEELTDLAHSMSRAMRLHIPERSLLALDEVMVDVLVNYDHHHRNPGFSGIPVGWPGIDEVTGGYQNGDLIVWVARPSVGKTYCLLHQAKAAWQANKSVLFVSMEMTLDQLGMRIGSYLAGVDPDCVRKGKLSFFAERRFRSALDRIEGANSLHFLAGNFKKRSEEVDMWIQELSPDIVFIDGMYLMRPANQRNNMGRYEATAYVVDELKTMALERQRPVVASSQFSREAGKGGKSGSLESIGYTDAISTHSTLIFSLKYGTHQWRHIRHRGTTVHRKKVYPYRVIELLKGREGESGTYGVRFSFAPFDFYEVPAHVALGEEENEGRPNLDYME